MEKMMLNFGTSAYLKLLALNPKPRDTEIRKRLTGGGGGYDFHKAMRRIAVENGCGRLTPIELETELKRIVRPPEQKAARSAIETFSMWLGGATVRPLKNAEQLFQSPLGRFSVKFSPDFELDHYGNVVQVHIWNTARPAIRIREAVGTMGLFGRGTDKNQLGILSLRTGELFIPQDMSSSSELADLLARDIERRIDRIRDEVERPDRRERPGKTAGSA
jgi:hypothetical protein